MRKWNVYGSYVNRNGQRQTFDLFVEANNAEQANHKALDQAKRYQGSQHQIIRVSPANGKWS